METKKMKKETSSFPQKFVARSVPRINCLRKFPDSPWNEKFSLNKNRGL